LDRMLKLQARTTIIIAHRFSTIKDADVIAEGRVVEQGTFNELAAKNGTFAALLRSQKT
jgi:ABC-type multidrug transport system fused ATPase/permease subunit